ncbi:histamine H2 receptor-like [Ptychodera flava]|uniref:histamine H2 receptor-like n=1 Tax=Ptychodera flava TaxID=63121 RepID=UPI003969F174
MPEIFMYKGIISVLGNILVILSPIVNKRLRTVTNFFLVSLAFADTLIGILVLPFSAYNELHRRWHMGAPFCNVYVSFDVLFCTASILNLFVICVDRYFAITRPMEYPLKMTMRRAVIAAIVLWAVSLLISFLPLHLGWNTPDGKVQNYDDPHQCGLVANTTYALVDGILLFFIPLTLMALMYLKIVLIARKQARSIRRTTVYDAHYKRSIDEHKATKIIAIVMGCFIVCWVPYFTAFTFCPAFHCNLNADAYAVIVWMGYFNSTMNPCLYAWLNREFRKAFKTIICCNRLVRRKSRTRSFFGDKGDPTSTSSMTMTITRYNGPQGNGYMEIGNGNGARV